MPGGAVSEFVTQKIGTSSRFQVHNTVTSQFIPPADASDPYRGTITVTSRSVYSLRRSVEEADDEETRTGAQAGSGFSMMDDWTRAARDFEVLDDELISGSSRRKMTRSERKSNASSATPTRKFARTILPTKTIAG